MKKVFSLALAVTCLAATAQESQSEPPQHIDVQKLSGQAGVIDNVVVPLPSEIFKVLDKLGRPKWAEVLHPLNGVAKAPGEREQTALLLGTIIAEGFIAVEAQNGEEVKKIGNSVRSLAKAISVEKAVIKRANAIVEAADKQEWTQVRRELDGALADVKTAMGEVKSEDLAQLVSLGGWLRGTDALAAVVQKDYTKDGAELLHQIALVKYFDKRLAALPQRMQKEIVGKVRAGLVQIRALMGEDDSTDVSEKSVKEIGAIASELVKMISQKANQ